MSKLRTMTPRITPVEAELHFLADTEALWSGRLHGPKCRYATTVQISYPLQQLRGSEGVWRVVIPEPSLWEPETPFLYEGVLSPADAPAEAIYFRQGLRRVQSTPRGLLLNGRPIRLRGKRVDRLEFQQALEMREAGYNTLVVSLGETTSAVCTLTDQIGFFVLVEVGDVDAWRPQIERLGRHPSLLAWIEAKPGVVGRVDPSRLLGTRSEAEIEADFVIGEDGRIRGLQGMEIGTLEA